MNKKSFASWRQIRQTARSKKVTRYARMRVLHVFLRSLAVVALLCVAVAGAYGMKLLWEMGANRINAAIPSPHIEEVLFTTDGVLPKEWVLSYIGLDRNTEILAVDIHEAKERLQQYGQIKQAVVSRSLPDRLIIRVAERVPMLNLAAVSSDGSRIRLLIAEDGTVYEGVGYERDFLSSLPFVNGIRLRRSGSGYEPLPGMEPVAELLRLARREVPHLYHSWEVVTCDELPAIKVRSRNVMEIVFKEENFDEQLAWLEQIMANTVGILDQVDLSFGRNVYVTPRR